MSDQAIYDHKMCYENWWIMVDFKMLTDPSINVTSELMFALFLLCDAAVPVCIHFKISSEKLK